jgi:hypothetical protein
MNRIAVSRRDVLRLAALGALSPTAWISSALAKGDLPTVQGIHDASGSVTVNARSAQRGVPVKLGDRVATGDKSQAVVVIGKDAFLLRSNTNVVFEAEPQRTGVLAAVVIATGKLLSVYAKRTAGEAGVTLRAPNATIGIRGTGAYVEAHDARSYLCLCYGEAAVGGPAVANPALIKTTHHENPVWIEERGGVLKVEKAPMLEHTDEELILLEKLTGREPPFVAMGLTGRY